MGVVPLPPAEYDPEGGDGNMTHDTVVSLFRMLLIAVVEYDEDGVFLATFL